MKDEPLYRNAAKNINATIANYTQLFADKKQEKEILAMAMIDIALRYEQERANKDVEVYNDILSSLTKEVEQVLQLLKFLHCQYVVSVRFLKTKQKNII